ncbi:hypothetical protein [Nocardia sp. alder85J]|uniref:hypothetical protein n=1 Tax=Nocardia sp. alder85J TaxID=2862949 RepID=UPI001CD6E4D7|nr:hypothetical protein [Nocardia sp. alder85J]MCX4098415.1 hypothetical protein [Nocardia sp. alder85J]
MVELQPPEVIAAHLHEIDTWSEAELYLYVQALWKDISRLQAVAAELQLTGIDHLDENTLRRRVLAQVFAGHPQSPAAIAAHLHEISTWSEAKAYLNEQDHWRTLSYLQAVADELQLTRGWTDLQESAQAGVRRSMWVVGRAPLIPDER